MKKIIFLITILLSAIIPLTTSAKTEQFYASNYIPNVYFHKIKGNTKLYAQAQFINSNSEFLQKGHRIAQIPQVRPLRKIHRAFPLKPHPLLLHPGDQVREAAGSVLLL